MLSNIIIFFAGSFIGSFFNILSVGYINRLLIEKTNTNPQDKDSKNKFRNIIRSFSKDSIRHFKLKNTLSILECPGCGNKRTPLFYIPVAGALFSSGECKYCGIKVGLIYALAEIFCGLVGLALSVKFGLNFYSAVVFLIFGFALSISVIDLKTQRIPNSLVIIFLLLAVYPIILNNSLRNNIYGFLVMSIFFLIILLIFPGGFGGGDMKFASVIGLYLGLEYSIIALETAIISGAVAGILYAVISGKGIRQKIPFAPFLTIGLLISVFFGRDILLLYYGLFYK